MSDFGLGFRVHGLGFNNLIYKFYGLVPATGTRELL